MCYILYIFIYKLEFDVAFKTIYFIFLVLYF